MNKTKAIKEHDPVRENASRSAESSGYSRSGRSAKSAASVQAASEIVAMIRSAGIQPSMQRMAVLELLASERCHPSAEEIYSRLLPSVPTLSRTTVYNTLHLMAEKNLVHEIEIEPGVTRYDLAARPPHGHFLCRGCGRIFDIELTVSPDDVPGEFVTDSVDVFCRGLCPECAAAGSAETD